MRWKMASSQQCSNCGQLGHFRASCPSPPADDLRHWRDAKKAFRRENPEEMKKLQARKEENRRWQEMGKTLPFNILDTEVNELLQVLHDFSLEIDELGRPERWQSASRSLDSILPRVREILNICKGFKKSGRLDLVLVNAEIFSDKCDSLEYMRDDLVKKVKTLVNGKIEKINRMHARNDPEEFIRYIYEFYPPRCPHNLHEIKGSTLPKTIKKTLLHYHPDKQVDYDKEWQIVCEAISKNLTLCLEKLK